MDFLILFQAVSNLTEIWRDLIYNTKYNIDKNLSLMTFRFFTVLGQVVRLIVGSWISLLQNLTCGKKTHELVKESIPTREANMGI